MKNEIDPVDDRDEFQCRIRTSNNWKGFFRLEDVLTALIDADAEKIAEIKAIKDSCEDYINELLSQYDEAPDRENRKAIVGSCKKYKPS